MEQGSYCLLISTLFGKYTFGKLLQINRNKNLSSEDNSQLRTNAKKLDPNNAVQCINSVEEGKIIGNVNF